MHHITKLAELFQKFPGIGPRQARRFVYFLLGQDKEILNDLSEQIKKIRAQVVECKECHRFFDADGYADVCDMCSSPNRDEHLLMVVEKDADLDAVEKSGLYHGRYFVLGGTIPILNHTNELLRSDILKKLVEKRKSMLAEIIIATSASPEGDITADHIREVIEPIVGSSVRISLLGRGLSTGTELEYSDTETIKNALTNRR